MPKIVPKSGLTLSQTKLCGFFLDAVSYLPLCHQCEALTAPPPALGTFDLWIFHPALIRTRYNPAISMYPPVIPNTQCRKSPMRLGTRGASAIFTATITHWAVYRPELCLDLISVSSCTWLVAPWTVRSPSIMLSQSSQRPVTSAAWISERNTIPSRNCTPNRSWCLLNSKPTFASTLWASQTFGW